MPQLINATIFAYVMFVVKEQSVREMEQSHAHKQ